MENKTSKHYTLLEFAKEILQEAKEPLRSKEIWSLGVKSGLDKKLTNIKMDTDTNSRIHLLNVRLYGSLKQSKPIFMMASKKPVTFWLKSRENELFTQSLQTEISKETKETKRDFKERDLHPLLVKFLSEDKKFDLYSKTIYHEKSAKSSSGKDKWNYPDIVGIHFPFSDYQESTLEMLANFNQPNYKLYSFELKISLDWSNLKESYFQAVSNSSWANEGYLVVFEDIDEEIINELTRLNASFGIGVIQLECETSQSRVILPSKVRELDIETLDMLVVKNIDFSNFIKNINKDIKANDKDRIAKDKYDETFDDEAMEKHLKDKKITKETL
ncbi:HrgA protein [Helicobacter pullorum]|uniref:HrgA protein n=1 Tax=Helicobacter pullorum TaxID=35818 RepID=UPI00081691BD|nr:HrgA protein [Helicobacter pullorum]OCR13726.1 HrgA protein [Helicobacter pullorum]